MKMMDTRMKLILMNDKENSSFVTDSMIIRKGVCLKAVSTYIFLLRFCMGTTKYLGKHNGLSSIPPPLSLVNESRVFINIACHAPHREYYLHLLLDPFGRYRYPELMSGMKLRNDNILNPFLRYIVAVASDDNPFRCMMPMVGVGSCTVIRVLLLGNFNSLLLLLSASPSVRVVPLP